MPDYITPPNDIWTAIEEISRLPEPQQVSEIERLIPKIAFLPKLEYELARKKVKDTLHIRVAAFDQLVTEYRNRSQSNGNFKPIYKDTVILSPVLDFSQDVGVLTITIQAVNGNEVDKTTYLVTSDRNIYPYNGEPKSITINDREVIIEEKQIFPASREKWTSQDIRYYLEGATVSPLEVFQRIESLLLKYLEWQDPVASKFLALWIMGTYLFIIFDAYPYINLLGPKGSGKTKALDVMTRQAFNGRVTTNISPAALFRIIEASGSTLGIDEAERLKNTRDPGSQDLRLILNAGYKKGSPAIRCEGENFTPREYDVYSPKIVAGIQGLDDVLESRCIVVNMLRAKPGNPIGKVVVSDTSENWVSVRNGLYVFSLTYFSQVLREYQDASIVGTLNNRSAELWRPLLAIAQVVDPDNQVQLYEQIYQYALEYTLDSDVAQISDEEAALINVLLELTSSGTEQFQPKAISRILSPGVKDLRKSPFNPQWVGYRLKGFGLKRDRKTKGTVYTCTREKAVDLAERFGITPQEKLP